MSLTELEFFYNHDYFPCFIHKKKRLNFIFIQLFYFYASIEKY